MKKNNIYYNADNFTLINGDCFKTLNKIEEKSIDKDTVKTHYYIKKKDSISDYTQPSIDILKNAPVLNNNASSPIVKP